MDKLARPLLVLHGTQRPQRVQFRDSLRLWDVLLKLGKPFEMGVYPGEIHFFRRAHILRDAWRRVGVLRPVSEERRARHVEPVDVIALYRPLAVHAETSLGSVCTSALGPSRWRGGRCA